MNMNEQDRLKNAVNNIAISLQDGILTAACQNQKLVKLDYRGSDLILRFENGRTLMISASMNERTDKPHLECALSPTVNLIQI